MAQGGEVKQNKELQEEITKKKKKLKNEEQEFKLQKFVADKFDELNRHLNIIKNQIIKANNSI